MFTADLPTMVVSVALLAALVAVLVLSLLCLRRPSTATMAVAGALAVLAVIAVSTAQPMHVPPGFGALIAVAGVAAAAVGGNPFTRRALDIATGKRVRETADGGIVIVPARAGGDAEARTLMRGGTVIGYLERIAVAISILVGYPAVIAAIVAVKGIGRFPELGESEARERFIIGTLASMIWAGVIGAVVRLALG